MMLEVVAQNILLLCFIPPPHHHHDFSEAILKSDVNVRICFMSAGEVNHKAIREIHPSLNIGCFIQKPVTVEYLIKRINAELE
jgi:hypothetical protein